MGLKSFLGFAPFAAFALIEKLIGIVPGLAAGLIVSLALVTWTATRHTRTINVLEVGSAVIFGGLIIVALSHPRTWSVWEVRLYVDGGLALVVFLGVLLGRPFTVQSAREKVSPDVARSPRFLRTNAVVSSVWGLAFAGMAAVDLSMTVDPDVPERRGLILTLAVLAAAGKFTQWYVKTIRRST